LKEETIDLTVWRTGFGRNHGPILRQTAECMNERMNECVHARENFVLPLPLVIESR